VPILRVLDKLPKVGREAVLKEMIEKTGIRAEQGSQVLDLAGMKGTNTEILDCLQGEFGKNAKANDGIVRLKQLLSVAEASGVPQERIRLDLSICRGLDYYTGTIYETFLLDKEDIGSVCSGGRYDNLAGLYTKQALPGVGASLGLDRLLAAMEEMNLLPKVSTPAPVLIVQFSADRLGEYQRLARTLRAEGIGVEVFPDAKKLGQQLKYADSKGFKFAIIAGDAEFAQGVWKIKDLAKQEEQTVSSPAQLLEAIRAGL
jgi:histidyl-tRNA synthetase